MTKKHVLLSSMALSCLLTGQLFGQSLGLDRPIGNFNPQPGSASPMAIAANGWVYNACRTGESITIKVSRDHGITWQPFTTLAMPAQSFDAPSIAVSGSEGASPALFVAGIVRNPQQHIQTVFVRRYDGVTGKLTAEPLSRTVRGEIYTCALAGSPVSNEGQSSLSLLYALSSDNSHVLLQQTSVDGGAHFEAPATVVTTDNYFRNIAICYGRSDRAAHGRYFMAWDEYTNPSAAWGKVYTARNTSGVSAGITAPVRVDNLDPAMEGKLRRPVLSVSATSDNDSASCTAVLLAEYNYSGKDDRTAIAGFTNERAHFTGYWQPALVADAGSQPALAFDPAQHRFVLSYYQKDQDAMRLLKADYKKGNHWQQISSNYADRAGLSDPQPALAIDPVYGQAAFSWNAGNKTGQCFDAEYNLAPAATAALEATRENQHNLISWIAGAAEDEGLVTLERSSDGRSYSSLATVTQKGSPLNNSYRDASPLPGVNYYRLKLGRNSYSVAVSLFVDETAAQGLSVFPNPVINRLTVTTAANGPDATVTVYDITGKACLSTPAAAAQTTLDLQHLPKGNYVIRYHNGTEDRFEKISKIAW